MDVFTEQVKDTGRTWLRWRRARTTEMIGLTWDHAVLGSHCAIQHVGYQYNSQAHEPCSNMFIIR